MSVPSRDFVSTKGLISLASTYLASIGLRSYTNRNGLAGALATCRTRCEACDSAGSARAGRAVPERILGSMSKKELHGCCDRICSRQRSRVAEQVKGACWLRLRRQAHARLDGADDANVRFFASVMCLHAPYRAIVRTVRTTTTDTQAPKSYQNMLLGSNRAAAALVHSAPLAKLVRLFLLSASPVRIAAECPPSVRARLIASVIGWMLQFPAILQYLVASEICSGKLGQGQQDCAIFDAGFESVGVEEAITAACSSCIRLYGVDRASQGTV